MKHCLKLFPHYYIYETKIVLMDDFDVPNYTNKNHCDKTASLFNDYQQIPDLMQFNNIPNAQNRILDLVTSSIDEC